ncbi:hypothetical protein AWH48_12180 [Domibacillus aminovorans]|uniref:Uncharacterized protein n=1 Tax=Domibacillus aminovorans TaxID=29332 RepID=A0A177KIZ7_9BACI|nr:hypothetical protein [Domibacillus aminovorans]OAH53107.1 hypothetical protein AWH48_12180 [Domibacillus aminovorans]
MTPIAGYENLTDAERKVFIRGHHKHLSSLSGNERDQYGLGHVVEVKANPQESAVDVYFTNGQQRQFTGDGVRD